jgi:hypothetical protein
MQFLLDIQHERANLPASRPMQSSAISSSIANLAVETARKPKVSPQPSNPWSVVTLTSSESATGKPLSHQAEAAA